VAAGIAVLLIQAGALSESARLWPALLIAPVAGRWAMSLVLIVYPYQRDKGLGRDMKDNARWPQAVLATVIAGAAAWFGAGGTGLLALAISAVLALLVAEFARRRVGGGLTGDLYGAICVLVETMVLVLFATSLSV
jgi:adenosylcobinamide-GDP ribazoletransferase